MAETSDSPEALPTDLSDRPKCLTDMPNEILLAVIARVEFSPANLSSLSLVNHHLRDLMTAFKNQLLNDIAEIQFPEAHQLCLDEDDHTMESLSRLRDTTKLNRTLIRAILSAQDNLKKRSRQERRVFSNRISTGLYITALLASINFDWRSEVQVALCLSLMPYEILSLLRFTSIWTMQSLDFHIPVTVTEVLGEDRARPLAATLALENVITHFGLGSVRALHEFKDGEMSSLMFEVLNLLSDCLCDEDMAPSFLLMHCMERIDPGVTAKFTGWQTGEASWNGVMTDLLLAHYAEETEAADSSSHTYEFLRPYKTLARFYCTKHGNTGSNAISFEENISNVGLCEYMSMRNDENVFVSKRVSSEVEDVCNEAYNKERLIHLATKHARLATTLREGPLRETISSMMSEPTLGTHTTVLKVRALLLREKDSLLKRASIE